MLDPLPTPDTTPINEVRDLQERCQRLLQDSGALTFVPVLVEATTSDSGEVEEGMAAVVAGVEVGRYVGARSKREARRRAARAALQRWDELVPMLITKRGMA
jgi:dsRNA-specific ribonuclease